MNARLLALAMACAVSVAAQAQDDDEYRLEIGAGAGLMGYLGDFNGSLSKDLQPMAAVVARYIPNPYMAVKMEVGAGTMKGATDNVTTYYPDYTGHDYTFKNTLVDVGLAYEYNFLPYGTGRDYRGAKRCTPFVWGGIGLSVAGAKAPGSDEKKTHAAFSLPLGFGVKYKLGERTNVGAEWAIHFAQSDELDGVKDPYYIKSSGLFKNTDCFTTLMVTLTYSFLPKCTTCNKDF